MFVIIYRLKVEKNALKFKWMALNYIQTYGVVTRKIFYKVCTLSAFAISLEFHLNIDKTGEIMRYQGHETNLCILHAGYYGDKEFLFCQY